MRLIPLQLPAAGNKLPIIASVSGGKDSTALMCALRESDIEARYVFADTGWEHPEHYEYLDTLRRVLSVEIDVVARPGGFVGMLRAEARFPTRWRRTCTKYLKLRPLRAYHMRFNEGDTVCVVGVRGAESQARSKLATWEDCELWGGWVWRPLMHWSVEDVLTTIRRHGVPIHPLYQRGHDRVGCWPCIMANKEQIRLVAEQAPERIDEIRALELEVSALRVKRNRDQPGRHTDTQATFFQTRAKGFEGIDAVVAWARTERGGRQLPLLPVAPSGGCYRWALCDRPGQK